MTQRGSPRTVPLKKPRKGGRKPVADLLERVLKKNNLSKGFSNAWVLKAWDDVVGKQLARTTRAVQIRDGVMIVRVQDNTAANFFTMQRHIYLERLVAALGDKAPRDLRFEQGALEVMAREVKPKPLQLTKSEHAHIETLINGATPDLLPAARRAAESLARARLARMRLGFVPCPICAELTSDSRPCQHCRVTLEQPLTKHWQSKLIRNPDHLLQDDPDAPHPDVPHEVLTCAKYRALEYLSAQLETLSLRIVQAVKAKRRKSDDDPKELAVYLEQVAQTWLAMTLGVPVAEITQRDHRHLPETVRGVLETQRRED